MKIPNFIKTLAPGVATLFGGPLGGYAVRTVLKHLCPEDDIDENATEAQLMPLLEKALSNADPETLKRLELAEAEVRLKMEECGVDMERIHADDRSDARARQIATKDKFPQILGLIVWLSLAAMVAYIVVNEIKLDGLLAALVGSMTAGATQVLNYFFGSSKGSSDKNKLMGAK